MSWKSKYAQPAYFIRQYFLWYETTCTNPSEFTGYPLAGMVALRCWTVQTILVYRVQVISAILPVLGSSASMPLSTQVGV